MKRYKSGFAGMQESEEGKWIQYFYFASEQERAERYLMMLKDQSTQLSLLKEKLLNLTETNIQCEEAINKIEIQKNKLKVSKSENLKFDLFVTSITLNIVCLLSIIVYLTK
jgi:hypothetical protein